MAGEVATTEAVFAHHMQALFARNVDDLVSDYTEESILFSANGISTGLEQIRGFFNYAVSVMTPDVLAVAKVVRQDVQGEYAFVVYAAPPTVIMGADTFYIRAGKIVMQSFAAQFGS